MIETLLQEVDSIRENHDKYLEGKRFNFFTAMHKERAEVQLHSRFISYLLSPTSGHGQKDKYLKIFVCEILNLEIEDFDLEKSFVIPNEQNKAEFENIDILIINKRKKQAIIIENKIDAGDSNKSIDQNNSTELENRSTYAGQLERYYTTIKTGRNFHGKDLMDFQCDSISIFYLSIDGRPPSNESVFSLIGNPDWKGTLSYASHVIPWLEKCIERTPADQLLVREFIQHYLNLIKKLTFNDMTIDEKLALKNVVSKNISGTKFLIENFKHVKWHAVHEFWIKLAERMASEGFDHVCIFPDSDFDGVITRITHNNENLNHGINFTYRGSSGYISGENNLSWGTHEPKRYRLEFDNELLNEINFSSFSSENTYQIFDSGERDNITSELIKDIKNAEASGYSELIKI